MQLLKSDEDCLYETDYERLHELFECMLLINVKQVEDQFRRVQRGAFEPTNSHAYDAISSNPFHHMKVSLRDSNLLQICVRLSQKTSRWMRLQSE